jgi:GH15 family glucan-1,4-alpha-glucosidase
MEPDGRLKPVYAVVPEMPLMVRDAVGVVGYRGMGPVRVGNQAGEQIQNDSYGSVILAAAQMFFDRRLVRSGDMALFAQLERLGNQAARLAFEPDSGIWEFRGRARVHTYSAAMCWAACNRLAVIAQKLGDALRAQHWREHARRIRAAILEQAWDPQEETFVESFGGKEVDCNLLLLQEIGLLSASDPRFAGTVAAVERRLIRNGHVMRYSAPDDFGQPSTAFLVCGFWYIDALAAMGQREKARELFTDLLRHRNNAGLLSEDVDAGTGELWGNIPQTYSMVGLIISALRLSKSWEEAFWRGS